MNPAAVLGFVLGFLLAAVMLRWDKDHPVRSFLAVGLAVFSVVLLVADSLIEGVRP